MKKAIIVALVTLSLLLFAGCSGISGLGDGSSSPASPRILRKAQLAAKWEMRHISLEIGAGEQLPILLKLADGARVDGYFYLESGNNVDFQIMANSLVYKPPQDAATSKGLTSDRFSFTATQAQGNSYTLLFRNTTPVNDKQPKVTVFLEIIYPSAGSVFTPLETK